MRSTLRKIWYRTTAYHFCLPCWCLFVRSLMVCLPPACLRCSLFSSSLPSFLGTMAQRQLCHKLASKTALIRVYIDGPLSSFRIVRAETKVSPFVLECCRFIQQLPLFLSFRSHVLDNFLTSASVIGCFFPIGSCWH